jgi:3',5'-cyclic AMP phosphodiesterase CpdA
VSREDAQPEKTIRIAHLSDIHFGVEDPANIAAVTEAVHVMSPDAVIVTGDLTAGGRLAEFSAAKEWIGRLPEPRLIMPGNHDTPYWNPVLRSLAPFDRYRRFIAPLSASRIDRPDLVARAINTARGIQCRLDWSKGAIDLAQIRRIAGEFAAHHGALEIFACHHPLVETGDLAVTGAVRGGAAAAALLADAGVDLILTGHVHNPFVSAVPHGDGLTYAVGAGTLSLRTRGSPASFSVIEADQTTLVVRALSWGGTSFSPSGSWTVPRRKWSGPATGTPVRLKAGEAR